MSGAEKPGVRKVPCPTCGEPSVFEPFNPYRPFCSERCRLIDLGRWIDGKYVTPGPSVSQKQAEEQDESADEEAD